MAKPEDLQDRWRQIYAVHLPSLAKSKDPVQQKWPVYLDHCFARIVLDNAIGRDKPWTEVLKQPAIRNMNDDQLRDAIELAEKIATGEVDLSELNEQSLRFRGKSKKRKPVEDSSEERKQSSSNSKKPRLENETVSNYFHAFPHKETEEKEAKTNDSKSIKTDDADPVLGPSPSPEDHTAELSRIQSSSTLTPFRKIVLALLCQIPRGRYSTYGALSDHISQTSSRKTCARAVGSGIRNNPFAPEVPCHRILAGDGSIGGFHGDWGKEGKFAREKHRLLSEEGVRFDSKGKVKGPPFRGFT